MTTITFKIRVRKGYVMVRVYIEIEHVKVKKSYMKVLVKKKDIQNCIFIILFITSL